MPAATSSLISAPSWFHHLFSPGEPLPNEHSETASSSKPSKANTPREFGFGAISAICTPQMIDHILALCGRTERRCRLLPARLTVYALLLMCLYPKVGYQRLMCHLAEAAPDSGKWPIPNKSSFMRARVRLGSKVMEMLFGSLAHPLADKRARGCFWRGRRLMAIDGSTLELAANPELEAGFGGPTAEGGQRIGPPLARVVGLIECGTHSLVDIVIARYRDGETTLAASLLRSIKANTLLLADRNFPGVHLFKLFTSAEADVLWRVKGTVANRVICHLRDGSYLARFGSGEDALTVRVIEYALPGSDTIYRLITNLLDPVAAPARELAALYAERWEIEACFFDFKVIQGASSALRSLSLNSLYQEFWALCTLYQVSCHLTYKAAMQTNDKDCDRISFTLAQDMLRLGARQVTGLSLRKLTSALRRAITHLTSARSLLRRRNRSSPRVARYKQPQFPSRERHSGPASFQQPRRPDVIPLTP